MKLQNLRNLLTTVVSNTKRGVSTRAETTNLRKVAKDILGRNPTKDELASLRYD